MARRSQVTCQCSAYDFPHRIGSGQCTGGGWCGSYQEIDGDLCAGCNCHTPFGCDVEAGLESITQAECVSEELRTELLKEKLGKLPVDMEAYLKNEYESHYGETRNGESLND